MNPRTLIFALATRVHYRPTLYSADEVLCSPDEEDLYAGGRLRTLKTERGVIDVAGVRDRLPAGWDPELVVVKMDATLACMPSGLSLFRCPKVLIIGAPHQFHWPLTNLMRYLENEDFDFIVSDHDRHHLHWFARAGYGNVHWLPGLNFNLRPRPIRAPAYQKALFVGQTGDYHPYRRELFALAERRGLPLTLCTAHPEQAADLYASHAICLNGSLNGDLNLRVFEVLGTGGFLLTDRLSSDSGLEMLFEDGKELVLYSGAEDLVAKIRHYLERPEEAMAIRQRGHERLIAEHHPDLKRQQLVDLVFNGVENPAFSLRDARFHELAALDRHCLMSDIARYEFIQEQHLRAYRIILYAAGESLPYVEDLPRLEYRDHERRSEDLARDLPEGLDEVRFLVLSGSETPDQLLSVVRSFVGGYALLSQVSEDLDALLRSFGFDPVEDRPGVYQLTQPMMAAVRFAELGARRAAAEQLNAIEFGQVDHELLFDWAQLAADLGALLACKRALEAALALDRSQVEVYLSLSDAHLALNEDEDALLCLHEAGRFGQALPDPYPQNYARLRETVGFRSEQAQRYLERVTLGGFPSLLPRKARILTLTNLFPPQELGGYGRKMWEFTHELALRGHEVRVLCGDAAYLWKEPKGEEGALEDRVVRRLGLYGEWAGGAVRVEEDSGKVRSILRENVRRVMAMIDTFRPDYCLMGNLDLIGYESIKLLRERRVPCVQCMGNFLPGWPREDPPDYAWYAAGPASAYLLKQMEKDGYRFGRSAVLYPGARIDRFFRPYLPRRDMPRIAFASLLMPYKGAHTLVDALVMLKKGGIEFRATIAGDSTDAAYVRLLREKVEAAGIAEWVEFPGFLDRAQLNALFCRSNILAFPSVFQEPFGISQVEAMASGLTVITSGRGGSGEVVRHEVDGLLFQGEDPVDFARKVAWLMANPDRWEQLAHASRERSVAFAIPNTVNRIEELFLEMDRSR